MAGDILDNRGRGEASWSWPAVHPEGRVFALIAAGLSLVAAFFALETLAWPLAALVLGILAFFRDPKRVTPQGDNLIVAPADGLVTLIRQMDPPRELVMDDGKGAPG
ncbi:MAG: phosphatidylserine decarboxylase, partial [Novosphingobium sp.]